MKALVGAFNQEKALVGAFSVIAQPVVEPMEHCTALIKVDTAGGNADMALLQEDLIDTMPAVEEANSISEELDKKVKFEIILISPHMLGKMQGQAKADVSNYF